MMRAHSFGEATLWSDPLAAHLNDYGSAVERFKTIADAEAHTRWRHAHMPHVHTCAPGCIKTVADAEAHTRWRLVHMPHAYTYASGCIKTVADAEAHT